MTKPFALKAIFARFRSHWENAPDVRKPNNNTQYQVSDAILAAFLVFFMQSRSFERQRILQSKKGRNNASSLFQIGQIPCQIGAARFPKCLTKAQKHTILILVFAPALLRRCWDWYSQAIPP
jgi:hypothetical protein